MERVSVNTLPSLNLLLADNRFLANGKNFPIDRLYATSASSRWSYENLWGIYLAKPEFAWMAVWMAATSRSRIQKRQIRYVCPSTEQGDHVGRIEVYSPLPFAPRYFLLDRAYLYLLDPADLSDLSYLTIAEKEGPAKIAALERQGFRWESVRRRGKQYRALVAASIGPAVIDIDRWQVAIVRKATIVPAIEVSIGSAVISELAVRISRSSQEVGENYIVDPT